MSNFTHEHELVTACRQGERLAQRALYERYAGKMFAVCLRYVRQRADAEDMLADGFMKVFTHIKNFKEAGSLEGWVRRIMVNECLSYLRKERMIYMENSHDEFIQISENYDHSVQMHADELIELIQNLPTGYRTIFNLYAIEGYTHKEIAEMLNINENTSKSQLSRARALLQKQLASQAVKDER